MFNDTKQRVASLRQLSALCSLQSPACETPLGFLDLSADLHIEDRQQNFCKTLNTKVKAAKPAV